MADTLGAKRGRRQRGKAPRVDVSSLPDNKPIATGLRLQPAAYQKAHRAAEAAGISLNAYVAALVERDVVDGDGRPVWAPQPPAADPLPESEEEPERHVRRQGRAA
ncbi:toxin-antitoxin system HicB family antitoxin [Streptosporangium sandarakinum]